MNIFKLNKSNNGVKRSWFLVVASLISGMATYAAMTPSGDANKFLICRAGWMMGGGPKKDKKFVNKIIKQIISGKNVLYVVNDKSGTPTYTFDFANNVKMLIDKEIFGLFNMNSIRSVV